MTNSINRRKFLRGSAVAGAAALATPALAESHGTTIKMQAAWGGGIFLENAQSFAARVNEMSGGSLTIEVLSVDAVVKTSQMQDGTENPSRRRCSAQALALAGPARKCWAGSMQVAVRSCLTN